MEERGGIYFQNDLYEKIRRAAHYNVRWVIFLHDELFISGHNVLQLAIAMIEKKKRPDGGA